MGDSQSSGNTTFLFIYESLLLGGIEKALIEFIEYFHSRSMRIVWLCHDKQIRIYEPWQKIIEDCEVQIVSCDIGKHFFKHDPVSFSKDESIIALAFDPMDFVRLECLSKEYENNTFRLFYMVPHFERDLNYVEEYYYTDIIRRNKIRKLRKIYKRWFDNGNILFFSKRHIDEMNTRYGIGCDDFHTYLYKSPLIPPRFDDNLAQRRAQRENFRIITCGRFTFPHKGYMFGLIDVYSSLKSKFRNIHLDIIGYGPQDDEARIREYVDKLPEDIKRDITFLGALSPEIARAYYDRAHVNISVAGGVIDGALTGLVSIPARHYTYSCEVYGWLDGDFSVVVADGPGLDPKPIIEELMFISDKEYIDICKKSYETVVLDRYDSQWLLNRENKINDYYKPADILFFKRIYIYITIKMVAKHILKQLISNDTFDRFLCFLRRKHQESIEKSKSNV